MPNILNRRGDTGEHHPRVGEIQAARLSVYGDAAAMITTQMVPDNSRPPYRAARVWVRRNGQWLMTISVQTDIQTP